MWVVLLSGLVAILIGPATSWLVREQLHVNCSMGAPGSEGANTWACSDGIGYLGVALVLGAMWFVVVLSGSLVAGLVRHERAARVLLFILAAISSGWILGWTWYGADRLVGDEYAPVSGPGYWAMAVGPAAIACAVALLAGLAGLVIRGRVACIFSLAAVIAFAVAILLQPGLSINVVPAAGVAAAATARAWPPGAGAEAVR
ncbi:hypothetical protein ACFQZV_01985 [Microbacterium koreense]|uniref:Uncharacterized protein n=1 Tax=Microbacterium koreense TaxID=323761 RepID=A0ABW2ZN83_9MICO